MTAAAPAKAGKTIKLGARPEIKPGDTCAHCNQTRPPQPKCWGCNRPMDDWPLDPGAFLRERGWTPGFYEETWLEPACDWQGPVTEEALAAAAERYKAAATYAGFAHVQKSKDGRKEDAEKRAAEFGEALEKLEAAKAEDRPVELRSQSPFLTAQAVRKELNRPIPWEGERTCQRPTYSPEAVERREKQLIFEFNGVLNAKQRAILKNMREQTSTVHVPQCGVCHRFRED